MHMHSSGQTISPGNDLSSCYGGAVRRASRILTRLYDEVLFPSGFNLTQYTIAYRLARHGSVTIGELAAWMDTDKTAMGRNLLPLERDGLISIRAGEDRRSRQVTLTPKGQAYYKKAIPLWKQAQKRVEKQLGKQWAAALLSLLNRVSVDN